MDEQTQAQPEALQEEAPKPKKVKKQKPLLKRYQDPTGEFSNRELKAGMWYLKHKLLLRHLGYGFLGLFAGVTMIIGIVGWGRHIFVSSPQMDQVLNRLIHPLINYDLVRTLLSPRDLSIKNVDGFSGTLGGFDFIATVENNNKDWIAHVDYVFSYGGQESEVFSETILPAKKGYLHALGEQAPGLSSNTRVNIKDIQWERVDPHAISDPQSYLNARHIFALEDVSFLNKNETRSLTHEISFTVRNDSAYSYWQVPFLALFESNGRTVGVAKFVLDSFSSGDEELISINSLSDTLRVDRINLIPMVNPFDSSVYMPLEGG